MKLIMRAIAEPASEPVTLGQLRDHVRGDDGIDDAALLGFGYAARQLVEEWLGRPILPQTMRGVCEAWPVAPEVIELSIPVTSVDLVSYTNAAQATVTWTAGWVARPSQGGTMRLRPATGASWPVLGADPLITVEATAGFDLVPEPIITAICQIAGHWFMNREAVNIGNNVSEMPLMARDLIRPYRFGGFLA